MKPCVTIQMKAIEQCFHVVLFIMLYKVVLTFKSLDETLVCDHLNESYCAVLTCVACVAAGGIRERASGGGAALFPRGLSRAKSRQLHMVRL